MHDSFDDCLSQFREVTFQGPRDINDYSERVRGPYDEFIDAADKARISLPPEERDTIGETIEVFNEARTHLKLWAQSLDDDWPDRAINDEYEKNPEELEDAAEPVFKIVWCKLDTEFRQEN